MSAQLFTHFTPTITLHPGICPLVTVDFFGLRKIDFLLVYPLYLILPNVMSATMDTTLISPNFFTELQLPLQPIFLKVVVIHRSASCYIISYASGDIKVAYFHVINLLSYNVINNVTCTAVCRLITAFHHYTHTISV